MRTGPPQLKTEMYYSAVRPTLVDMSKGAELVVVAAEALGHSAACSVR